MSRFERMVPIPEQIEALGAILSNLDEVWMTDCERAEAVVWAWEGMRAKGIEVWHTAASADTHPQDGDVKQAPLVSGAVGAAETPKGQTDTVKGTDI